MKANRWSLAGRSMLGALFAALQACSAGFPDSPLLELSELPRKALLVAVRGEAGQLSLLQATLAYDTSGGFCGTLRSPRASLGGVPLTVLDAGLRSYPTSSDGNMHCSFPIFELPQGPLPPGPLTISDGRTTLTAEFAGLDPGRPRKVAPAGTDLAAGQTVQMHVDQPDGVPVRDLALRSANAQETHWYEWPGATSTSAGDLAVTVPDLAVGDVTLLLSWTIGATSTACTGFSSCTARVEASTRFTVTIRR